MAFEEDMVYLRWEFKWGTTQEIQDTGLWCHLTHPTGMGLDWQVAVDAAAAKAVEAWHDSWGTVAFSKSVIGVRAIAYHYDAALKKVLHRGEAGFTGDNTWKGSAGTDMPPENTLALSLWTFTPGSYVPNAARRRGRMYLPTLSFDQLGGDGQLTQGQAGVWLDMAGEFFAALQGVIQVPSDGHLRPRVVSRGGNGGPSAEATYPITWLRMGRVVDTQRRRRNKLPEQYVDLELP